MLPQTQNKQSKNLLLLSQYEITGGTRTYVKQLLAYYAKNQYQTTMVTAGPQDDSEIASLCRTHSIIRHEYADFRKARRLARPPFSVPQERHILKDFIAHLKPDYIVASVGIPGMFLGHMDSSAKCLYILHTSPTARKSSPIRSSLRRRIWNYHLPKQFTIATVSQYAKLQIAKHWGPFKANAVCVIPNTAGPIVRRGHKSLPSPKVLTVGHVVDYKNPFFWIETAADVISKVPHAEFTWIGSGPLLNECRRKVNELGLGKSIFFPGASADPSPHYANCSIYSQPSIKESLGISALDAMRRGIPVVVAKSGGLPELIHSGTEGFVVDLAEGPNTYAGKIVQLLCDDALHSRMRSAVTTRYEKQFDSTLWEARLTALHEAL